MTAFQFHASLLLLLTAGCEAPPAARHHMPGADPGRGKRIIGSVGCGACHLVPGLDWPRGRMGPPLTAFAERTMIGGRLPNRPDVLVAWIRDAPRLVPGTAMPAMPVTQEEARDVAAYLYTLDGR